jgi:GNAT superfamily N-acetyltransferase
MKTSCVIREADLEDAATVHALWAHLVREHEALDERFVMADDAPERWLNDFPHWIEDLLHCFLVAEVEGRSVGFIHAQCWEEPPIYATVAEVFVIEIYVHPDYRGQEIGAAMVDELKTWSRSQASERLRFGVLAANTEGHAFWEAQGARPISIAYTIDLEIEKNKADSKPRRRIGF